mmetsp:Transcript_2844/g.3644  ORF Transcript_2844/g.3644 Transcript_2844/m.3644 type:complete len:240 (+) Transcript_2844:129-848(+)
MNATGPSFAAAAAAFQSSPSPQRKSKYDAAAAEMLLKPTKIKLGSFKRDKTISKVIFEEMLRAPYGPRKNNTGAIKSGKDKRGHTLYFDEGYVYCEVCHKRVQYGSVVSHIIGDIHCERVARNLQEQQDVDSVSVEGDEAVVSDDTTGQAKIPALLDYDRMPLDAADGKKKSATKQKASKKKADEDDDGDSKNALTGQGGLVVNGLDIVKYIRGLERRVSDLEKKFEAATLTENEDTLV